MRKFLTQKDVEAYLEQETRSVRLPGGRQKELTCSRLTWRNLEGLLSEKICTEEYLTGTAEGIARETGKSLPACLSWVIGYAFW